MKEKARIEENKAKEDFRLKLETRKRELEKRQLVFDNGPAKTKFVSFGNENEFNFYPK